MKNGYDVAISIALPPMARVFHVSPTAVGFGITIYVLSASPDRC